MKGSVHGLVAQVLMIPVADVRPEADLIRDLGAESIDFLELLFGLDEIVGVQVLPDDWRPWINERVPDFRINGGITVAVFEEFATFTASQQGKAT